jgi:hypothetical protein
MPGTRRAYPFDANDPLRSITGSKSRTAASPDTMLDNPVCSPARQGQQMQFDRLKRRELITLVGGAVAWPLAARAPRNSTNMAGVFSATKPDT